ncbi:zinc-dependent alcohol dehydrogenase [Cohnella silvisoli]|uniref:Zinc-binding alcohol dehydrogenase n=1 Tax=Cohnella silvisoli TaxID=2873699 RepID=A0ABV1KR62_9BACL|nr:zinc-binding alcohol dehydrogenase [Cohnella silvisoli]MCD9021764.1 zinc-binding alcohol dehydrogenase [Cohnella silvisoli]
MYNKTLYFTGPGQVEIRESAIPESGAGTVLVKALVSGISSGTELLIYRGLAPQHMPADSTISSLSHSLAYPLPYGYCMIGRVVEVGRDVDPDWIEKKVFAFHHHSSYFLAAPDSLICIPEDLSLDEAIFMPNMETAVNLLLDGRPLIGERVAVFGQGIVGLLTVSLLALQPVSQLLSFDLHPARRNVSLTAGAHYSVNPLAPDYQEQIESLLSKYGNQAGVDLTYELSGSPSALDQAVALTGYDGRIIVGSWYGLKRASLDLGSHFHRSRIRLISSQVSTIAPDLLGRWNNARRIDVAWQMIRRIRPDSFITHRFPLDKAAEAYEMLDKQSDQIIQAVIIYE